MNKSTKKPPNIEDLYACLQCGYCTSICPVFAEKGWESFSPRGKIYWLKQYCNKGLMDKILKRKFERDEQWIKCIYSCTSCGACNVVCHENIKLSDFWEEIKEWLVKDGIKPLQAHKDLYNRISDPNKRNPFLDEKDPKRDTLENRGAWLPENIKLSTEPDVLFFVGCTSSYRLQMLARSAVQILTKANIKFTILGEDEWCCGSPLLRTGQADIIKKEYMEHNLNEIKKRGVDIVVTACAGCYNTLKNDYPKVVGELPFKLYHLSEYLELLIQNDALTFTKHIDKKVTYHDPCHLGRHGGVYEAPREVLKSIPGIELIEMPGNREMSQCCGAGGGFKMAFNDTAVDIAVKRVKEAKATGAELIITPCPFCVVNLNAGAKKANIQLKTIDLMQLVTMAI